MRPVASLLVVACALVALPRRAEAGPWMPGRYHFYLQLRESFAFADDRYDARGDRQPIRLALDASGATAPSGYREWLSDLFAEVGLAARLSLLVDFRFFAAQSQPVSGRPDPSSVGPSDLWLAAKLLLFDDELTSAFEFALTVPTGDATTSVPLGQGDVRADLLLLLGKLFEKPDLFFSVEAGLRLRGSATVADPHAPGQTTVVQYSHELRMAAQGGYRLAPVRRGLDSILFAVKLEGAYAFQAPVEDNLGILVSETASYFKLGPEITWSPTSYLHVVVGGHYFVAGRSTPAFAEIAAALAVSR